MYEELGKFDNEEEEVVTDGKAGDFRCGCLTPLHVGIFKCQQGRNLIPELASDHLNWKQHNVETQLEDEGGRHGRPWVERD